MYKVIKRDGSVVLFDITKIIEAIKRSFVSVESACTIQRDGTAF